MYFHTEDNVVIDYIGNVVRLASAHGQRVRIAVDSEGNLRIKRGEGMWSAPFAPTPDPYQELPKVVNGMKWFINEEGMVYDYPAEYQRMVYPNDHHVPYDTEEEALEASDRL